MKSAVIPAGQAFLLGRIFRRVWVCSEKVPLVVGRRAAIEATKEAWGEVSTLNGQFYSSVMPANEWVRRAREVRDSLPKLVPLQGLEHAVNDRLSIDPYAAECFRVGREQGLFPDGSMHDLPSGAFETACQWLRRYCLSGDGMRQVKSVPPFVGTDGAPASWGFVEQRVEQFLERWQVVDRASVRTLLFGMLLLEGITLATFEHGLVLALDCRFEVPEEQASSSSKADGRQSAPAASPNARQIERSLAVLGLSPGASPEAVRSAYRDLVKFYHPDVHPPMSEHQQKEMARRLQEVQEAYDLLRS